MVHQLLRRYLGFTPTADQEQALQAIAAFLCRFYEAHIFLLLGYAGTGKTTLLQTLVKTLPKLNLKTVLLAPTGRAAKVMSRYAGAPAFTLHKYLYRLREIEGKWHWERRGNQAAHTLYIVDEASMISSGAHEPGGADLLQDLWAFVAEGRNCKVLFAGDTAQLPPVGTSLSPALSRRFLQAAFSAELSQVMLREVLRQSAQSQILHNATLLRAQMPDELHPPQWQAGRDVHRLEEAFAVEEALQNAYATRPRRDIAIIVRSNKRANQFNQQIRRQILAQEDLISAGDLLMVVKNNYHWLPPESEAGFIANGDMMEVQRIMEWKELYGYRFARCEVQLLDYPSEPAMEAMLLLDVLELDGPSLAYAQWQALYAQVAEDYQDIPGRAARAQALRRDPYLNALQVKYAYTFTAHKAQGGQWPVVFVEKPWQPNENIELDDLRWLYTAITRAEEELWLLGFPDDYFAEAPPEEAKH